MPQTKLTKAQAMAADYAARQIGEGLVNPSDNPAWHDRETVPSPPRRDGAPKISADGVDERGRKTFAISGAHTSHATPATLAAGFPDGGGSPSPALNADDFLVGATGALFVPESVRNSPTWQAAGSQEAIDERAVRAAGQITYLVERAPDQAMRYFRRVLSHPQTGILIYDQLDAKVRDELAETFIRIALRKPWVFQICRLLLALRGHVSGPHLFRAVCALAASHAFLAYADVVSPFGHLEDAAREMGPTPEEQAEQDQEDSVLAALLRDQPDFEPDDTPDADDEGEVTEEEELEQLEEVEAATDAAENKERFLSEAEIAKLSDDELDELTTPDTLEEGG